MSKHHAIALGLVFGVCLVIPAELVADVYDDFGDSSFWQGVEPNDSVYQPPGLPDPGFDPNLWDMDDPHWTFYPLVCSNPYAEIITGEYADRALRVYADADPLIGKYAFMAAALEGPDPDPNTSTTHWDDTTDHYMLALCYVGGGYEDPNDDRGRAALIMHGNPAVWQAMALLFDFDEQIGEGDAYPHTHLIGLETGNGTEWKILVRVFIDPNAQHTGDPCDFTIYEPSSYNYLDDPKWQGADINQWEREGIWLLYQFEHDPNFQSGDPNGKFVRGTIWKGDKYDWDGTWLLECECSGPT